MTAPRLLSWSEYMSWFQTPLEEDVREASPLVYAPGMEQLDVQGPRAERVPRSSEDVEIEVVKKHKGESIA